MMCKSGSSSGCCKIGALVFVIIAVVMAVLACALPADKVGQLLIVAKFFDVMLPILGAGALIKYLFSHHHCCSKKDQSTACDIK
jgi:hypothetical protein